jgi:UDP-N-acetylglucosamine 2-epimerase (non-hydrolysing)
MRLKILFVFGTRPEAIKMAPVVKAFLKVPELFDCKVCLTAQHREMLDQVIDFFELKSDYDLNLMKPNQNLYELTANILVAMKSVLDDFKPDFVFVHGDTTTSTAAAMASFYAGAQVCHVEAGLRTYNKKSPFPEEMNRAITGRLADWHFAPTEGAKQNLLKENISSKNILVTGNTVIDALLYSVEKVRKHEPNAEIAQLKAKVDFSKKVVLVTGHRRENFGQGFLEICKALQFLSKYPDVEVVYPVHLNPQVQKPVYELLSNAGNIHLVEPLAYESFIWLMDKSYLVITDSGGIQEEAPTLGKPVLVMRSTTERPEAVEAGTVILVGANAENITREAHRLLTDAVAYKEMSKLHNPYGDGKAASRIVDFFKHYVSTSTSEITLTSHANSTS